MLRRRCSDGQTIRNRCRRWSRRGQRRWNALLRKVCRGIAKRHLPSAQTVRCGDVGVSEGEDTKVGWTKRGGKSRRVHEAGNKRTVGARLCATGRDGPWENARSIAKSAKEASVPRCAQVKRSRRLSKRSGREKKRRCTILAKPSWVMGVTLCALFTTSSGNSMEIEGSQRVGITIGCPGAPNWQLDGGGFGKEVKYWMVGYRFGEALHPGPYSEGGASSSGPPLEVKHRQRSDKEGTVEVGGIPKKARRWEHTAQRGDRWILAEQVGRR